jgi:hypothetical protein
MVDYSVEVDGFSMVAGLLSESVVEELIRFLEESVSVEGRRGGLRNLLDLPTMRDLAESSPIRGEIEAVLGRTARVVRGILFDKTEDANWKVPWHQDVTIAVSRRVDAGRIWAVVDEGGRPPRSASCGCFGANGLDPAASGRLP